MKRIETIKRTKATRIIANLFGSFLCSLLEVPSKSNAIRMKLYTFFIVVGFFGFFFLSFFRYSFVWWMLLWFMYLCRMKYDKNQKRIFSLELSHSLPWSQNFSVLFFSSFFSEMKSCLPRTAPIQPEIISKF